MKYFALAAMLLILPAPASLAAPQNAMPPPAAATPIAAPDAAPVNPHATPAARALLRYLDSISGHYTLTGQHNFINSGSRWSDRIYDLTGKYPGLFGVDFGFSGGEDKDSILARPAMIKEAERQYENGSVIAVTWHAVRPTDNEPVSFRNSVQGHLTDYEWKELLTPGSDLYKRWCAQVDVIAGYLKQLQDAGVPVLYRAYHEMNGNWFWWGGRPGPDGSAALYRQLYNRFVNIDHLNNLIWVWNVNAPSKNAGPFADYFPGSKYVDVFTVDNYGSFDQSDYTNILALAGNKPIALAEVGAIPSLATFAQQPRWAYFMVWAGLAELTNSMDHLQKIYHTPALLTRGDPVEVKYMAAIREASASQKITIEPVSPDASAQATALLARLYAASGKSTLSGQRNDASSPAGSTDFVFEATRKHPAIYSADLGIPESARVIIDEAKRQHKQHSIVSLRWLPANPAGDPPLSPGGPSDQVQLTDFEWKELLKPGSALNGLWQQQVDGIAVYLKQLQDAHIPVLWSPYVESNTGRYWWAGRKGIAGSAELYRMLFDRLVKHDKLHNLIWVWEAAPAGFGGHGGGQYSDFFPGLLYTDAVVLDMSHANPRFPMDSMLKTFSVGKAIGVSFDGVVPDPSFFARQPQWAWFLLSPDKLSTAAAPVPSPSLLKLYNDPRILSRESLSEPEQ